MSDRWPDEPEEFDPESRWREPEEAASESRWGDPERDLPRVPEVTTTESDVDPHLFNTFWVSVLFANAALFGLSLGAMLWYFRGQALLGGALVVAGCLAALRTYVSYRRFVTDDDAARNTSADGGSDATRGDPESPRTEE